MKRAALALILILFSHAALGKTGNGLKSESVELKKGDTALGGAFKLGTIKGRGTIILTMSNKKKHIFWIKIIPDKYRTKTKKDGKTTNKRMSLPDAVISFSGLVNYHIRPRMRRYTDSQQQDLAKRWDSLLAASRRLVEFEARQKLDGVDFYLDGRFAGHRQSKAKMMKLTFSVPKEGEIRNLKSFKCYDNNDFLPLEIKYIANPGEMKNAELSLKPGLCDMDGVPFIVGTEADNLDVGVVKQMKGSWALECDEFLSRTAFDGMPETAHFSVPKAYYVKAWALCAVEPTAYKDPVITARLTRYATSGRSEAIADFTMRLPSNGGKAGEGVSVVGEVSYEKDGKRLKLPLYLVEFILPTGDILDLLSMKKDRHASMNRNLAYLDFEFLGKTGGVSAQWDSRRKPDKFSTSAIHVFAATLEKSPVELRLVQEQPGNIFHNDEKPKTRVLLKSIKPCEATLRWRIYNVDGKTLKESREALKFAAAGAELEVEVDLSMPDPGWYGIDVSVNNSKGAELLKHRAAFALLGKDTRKAGYDSPYGTWWFAGAHYGVSDPKIAGPMLFKAGLRKTTFGWGKYSEKDFAPWKITLNQLSRRYMPKLSDDKKKSWGDAEEKIKKMLERFPHCEYADIFHESYSSYVPAELLGCKEVENEATKKKNERMVKIANFACEFYRERFPDIKLIVGNTTSSAALIAALFRHGFDSKFIDYIGMETVGQTCMPEKLWDGGIQGIWLGRETARKFGHDLPVTGCYEFTARTDRNLGGEGQAEYIARDMLLCHAYKFDNINPAIIHDVGNAYFNTLWGAGGLCRRNPLLYPKPAYVAMATLTKVLDRVKCERRVDTGSLTVYALEFKCADGKTVYSLWNARGTAELALKFPKSVDATLVGFYGKERKKSTDWFGFGKTMSVATSTAPVYLITPVKLKSIKITGRKYADPPNSFKIADKMDDIGKWELRKADMSLNRPKARTLPIRVPGDFTFAQVDDPEKGDCLQLKLNKKGKLPDLVSEYAVIKLRKAVPVPRKPTDVGVWVKGDSGWGKIIFEIQGSTGALWRTEGAYHDWPGDLSICHDGWRFISFPIDNSSKKRNISAGRRWNTNSPLPTRTKFADKSKTVVKRGKTITFPIKIVGLYVVVNRKALDLTEMKEAPAVLRFKDIGTFKEEKK